MHNLVFKPGIQVDWRNPFLPWFEPSWVNGAILLILIRIMVHDFTLPINLLSGYLKHVLWWFERVCFLVNFVWVFIKRKQSVASGPQASFPFSVKHQLSEVLSAWKTWGHSEEHFKSRNWFQQQANRRAMAGDQYSILTVIFPHLLLKCVS